MRLWTPSGRADDVVAAFDGATVRGVLVLGKHLIYDFGRGRFLHVHLGRFGSFRDGPLPEPPVEGVVRLRGRTRERWFELRGASAADVYGQDDYAALSRRIGPNPLDPAAKPAKAFAKFAASDTPIAVALMDQAIVAGIGNIYRSEILYLHGVDPRMPASALDAMTWRAMWRDLRGLMTDALDDGRIVTTRPQDRARPTGRVRADDRFYVYHRAGRPCRRCGAIVRSGEMAARRVYWCPREQAAAPSRTRTKPPRRVGLTPRASP